ncbi:ABC transporter ATP-binding protein [Ruegeria pomeroyi]|nr:ABC transporter ATP-binding protein [Ruegeria pomeroyi]
MSALVLENLCKSFGKTEIIRDANLDVETGERRAIIGPNGAGKSTLFNLISGRLRPSAGSVRMNGAEIGGTAPHLLARRGLSRSFQVSNLFAGLTVRENLMRALLRSHGYGVSPFRFPMGNRALRADVDDLLERSDLTSRANTQAGELAYADQRSLEIAMTIAGKPSVVLLDEPTAGMSREETTRAIERIKQMTENRTLVIVEHDMGVVFSLADRISVLVRGHVIATGKPDDIRKDPRVQEAYLGAEHA